MDGPVGSTPAPSSADGSVTPLGGSAPKTTISRERIVMLPEPMPRRRRWAIVVAVILTIAAVSGTLAALYTVQRNHIRVRDAALAGETAARRSAESQAQAQLGQIRDLQNQLTNLRAELQDASGRLESQQQHSAHVGDRIDQLKAKLGDVESRLQAIKGPQPADGRHIAYVVAVGADQTPGRLIVDFARWFTGKAADRAAAADAKPAPPNPRYLRNTTTAWSTLEVASPVSVKLRAYQGGQGLTSVSLHTLQQFYSSGDKEAPRHASDPYWIVMKDGQVRSLIEQRYP